MLKILLTTATLAFLVLSQCTVFAEQESTSRETLRGICIYHPLERVDPPILKYNCSHGHFGNEILVEGSNIISILLWKDGTIAWEVKRGRRSTVWFQETIPAEKVEAAVQKIAENFAKYPAENRPRWISIFLLYVDTNFSQRTQVYSSQHYESFGMDYRLMDFYMKNRKVFQSDDKEAILETIMAGGDEKQPNKTSQNEKQIRPDFMSDFKSLVKYYRDVYPQAGLAEKNSTDFSKEELLKCIALYKADVEHLLLAEKTVIDLVPSAEGLKPKHLETRAHDFTIEIETKDGKTKFFYNPKGVVVQSF